MYYNTSFLIMSHYKAAQSLFMQWLLLSNTSAYTSAVLWLMRTLDHAYLHDFK
jgi:hypothetical protein